MRTGTEICLCAMPEVDCTSGGCTKIWIEIIGACLHTAVEWEVICVVGNVGQRFLDRLIEANMKEVTETQTYSRNCMQRLNKQLDYEDARPQPGHFENVPAPVEKYQDNKATRWTTSSRKSLRPWPSERFSVHITHGAQSHPMRMKRRRGAGSGIEPQLKAAAAAAGRGPRACNRR